MNKETKEWMVAGNRIDNLVIIIKYGYPKVNLSM